jgi:carbon monoxide dehydrogenase subunit G
MGKHQINQSATSAAPPGAVWALLSDVTTWAGWAPFDASELEQAAPAGDPNGVGAHRCFRRGRRTTHEEVVAFEPGSHFAYRLLSGVRGVTNYRADVTLAPTAAGGTEISWRSTFDANFGAGRLVVAVLGRFIGRVARALAGAAEEHVDRQTPARD